MRQVILYVIFALAMVLGSHGELSAASRLAHCSKDRLEKVEHKQDKPEAQVNDASLLAYGVCGNRPQRLSPSGNIYANPSASRLTYNKIRFCQIPYQPFQAIASNREKRRLQYALMSPVSIMSFACGIYFVSYIAFLGKSLYSGKTRSIVFC